MSAAPLAARIRTLTKSFVADIVPLIRAAALEVVQEALGAVPIGERAKRWRRAESVVEVITAARPTSKAVEHANQAHGSPDRLQRSEIESETRQGFHPQTRAQDFESPRTASAGSVLFIDDSGIGGASGVTLLSGILARRESWDLLEREWLEILQLDPRVSAFHMVDAFGRRGDFSAWDQRERDHRFELLSASIARHATCSCTTYLSIKDYDAEVRGKIPKRLDNPFFPLFVAMIAGMPKLRGVDFDRDSPIDVLLDHQRQFGHKALAETKSLFRILPEAERSLYGSIGMRKVHERIVPLEAADMLAWCQHRKLTKEDAVGIPAYQCLMRGVFRNHFHVDADFLHGWVASGYESEAR